MRQRDLKFTFVVGEGKLAFDVVEFELEEALCEPFRLNLKLASDKNAIDFRQVLDQPGTFTLWQDGRPARYVHGIVSHFTQGSSGFAGPATNCCWNRSWRAWSCAATGGYSRRRVFRRFSRRCSRNTGCSTTNSASTMSTCRANTACRPATAITTCTTGWPSRKAWSTTSASTNNATPWSAATGSTSRSVSPAARTVQRPAGGRQPAAGASFFPLQRKCSYGSTDPAGLQLQAPDLRPGASSRWRGARASGLVLRALRLPRSLQAERRRPAFQRKPPQRAPARCAGGIGQRRRPAADPGPRLCPGRSSACRLQRLVAAGAGGPSRHPVCRPGGRVRRRPLG